MIEDAEELVLQVGEIEATLVAVVLTFCGDEHGLAPLAAQRNWGNASVPWRDARIAPRVGGCPYDWRRRRNRRATTGR